MKIKALAVAAVIALGAAGAANAGTFWVGPNGGLSIPSGDFGDAAKLGYNGGLSGTYMIDPMWGVGADFGYHAWDAKDEVNEGVDFLLGTTGSEVKFSAMQYTAHVMWVAPGESSVKPWGKLGVGSYSVKTAVETPLGDADDSESKVGFNIGGGAMFKAGTNMGIGLGATYHMINTKDEDTGATNTNLITTNVALLWSFGGAK
jgi:opacity protein-like surface antigen